MTPVTKLDLRTHRYEDMIPLSRLRELSVAIIGVGGIGRPLALALAVMGVGSLILVDDGEIEEVNLGTQGWLPKDIGSPKVQALMKEIRELNPECIVEDVRQRFEDRPVWPGLTPVVVSCLDSISTRADLWKVVQADPGVLLFVDGRMGGWTVRVLAWQRGLPWDYGTTLFPEEEAEELPCTAKSTVHVGSLAATLGVGAITRWLNRQPPVHDMVFDMATGVCVDLTSYNKETPDGERPAAVVAATDGTRGEAAQGELDQE